MDAGEKKEVHKQLLAKASDLGMVEILMHPEIEQKIKRHRLLSIVLAIAINLTTFVLIGQSSLPTEVIAPGSYGSAQGEFLTPSLIGLLLVLFSNKRMANYTGYTYLVGRAQINKPSPVVLLRLTGWILLIVGLILAISYS
jgi:hypothetical protein